jgi:hypothetical protein
MTKKIVPLNEKPNKIAAWTLLSDDVEKGKEAIRHAKSFGINQLQLSHELVHDLKDLRKAENLSKVTDLTQYAKDQGIDQVYVWDHSFYHLSYYPDSIKTPDLKQLDLDRPGFWQWLKNDYRELLSRVNKIDGIVLTFIETGTRIELQHSNLSGSEKIAMVVDSLASLIIDEAGLGLMIRTFSYTDKEYTRIMGAINKIKHPKITLMMKECPHDFFLLHPNDPYVGTIDRPTIVEFDAAGEFNGQGQIANTFVSHFVKRGGDLLHRKNVLGYAARLDRFNASSVIGTPTEVNLYAIDKVSKAKNITSDSILSDFIDNRYGSISKGLLKPAFESAFDIITSTLYTLGTNTANHSALDYDPYSSSYARHATGKWSEDSIYIGHGVNKSFHFWKDIMNILAPKWAKKGGTQLNEIPQVLEKKWLDTLENLDLPFLNLILTEKKFGISRSRLALDNILSAETLLTEKDFKQLKSYFEKTYFISRLHLAVCKVYFGTRAFLNDIKNSYEIRAVVHEGIEEIKNLNLEIELSFLSKNTGDWQWEKDIKTANRYVLKANEVLSKL